MSQPQSIKQGATRLPYGSEWIVSKALADFRHREDLPEDGGTSASTVSYPIGPWHLTVPNVSARRRALLLHDVQHLATGYATDWAGETQIAAFELGSGCGRYAAPWVLATLAFTVGVFIHPGAVWRAFLRGRVSNSLFRISGAETVLHGTVGELRRRMALPVNSPTARVRDAVWFGVALLPAIVLSYTVVGALLSLFL